MWENVFALRLCEVDSRIQVQTFQIQVGLRVG